MSMTGIEETPYVLYLAVWTDIFGKRRKAVCTDERALEPIRRVDPDVLWYQTGTDWTPA